MQAHYEDNELNGKLEYVGWKWAIQEIDFRRAKETIGNWSGTLI